MHLGEVPHALAGGVEIRLAPRTKFAQRSEVQEGKEPTYLHETEVDSDEVGHGSAVERKRHTAALVSGASHRKLQTARYLEKSCFNKRMYSHTSFHNTNPNMTWCSRALKLARNFRMGALLEAAGPIS